MRIGRKISGEIALDVTAAENQRPAQIGVKRRGHDGAALQKGTDPQPGETAEGYFEAAGPVNSDGVGILLLPGIPLGKQLVGKTLVSRQQIGLRQNDEVLMAIQFPRDLGVAYQLEIEILH